jgi:hypothetical protein
MQRDVVVVERMWAIRTPQFQKKKKQQQKKSTTVVVLQVHASTDSSPAKSIEQK